MKTLFNSIVRGYGSTIGRRAANSSIDSAWKFCWGFVKWCIIITFMIGLLQGLFGK